MPAGRVASKAGRRILGRAFLSGFLRQDVDHRRPEADAQAALEVVGLGTVAAFCGGSRPPRLPEGSPVGWTAATLARRSRGITTQTAATAGDLSAGSAPPAVKSHEARSPNVSRWTLVRRWHRAPQGYGPIPIAKQRRTLRTLVGATIRPSSRQAAEVATSSKPSKAFRPGVGGLCATARVAWQRHGVSRSGWADKHPLMSTPFGPASTQISSGSAGVGAISVELGSEFTNGFDRCRVCFDRIWLVLRQTWAGPVQNGLVSTSIPDRPQNDHKSPTPQVTATLGVAATQLVAAQPICSGHLYVVASHRLCRVGLLLRVAHRGSVD